MKNRNLILCIIATIIIILSGIGIGYFVFKENDKNTNDNFDKEHLSRIEAKNKIINSVREQDFICTTPEYVAEQVLENIGVNYVYCYLKYDSSSPSKINISYEVLEEMISPNFNVSVDGIKSIINENNEYTYGSLSAFWGNIFLENNYGEDIIEIKIEIEYPFESIIKFSYTDELYSDIKIKKGTNYGNYIYTISEEKGIYNIYHYDNKKNKYLYVSNYECENITHLDNYYSEYGKYKEVESCLIKSNLNKGYLVFNDNNFVLFNSKNGKKQSYKELFLIGDSEYFITKQNNRYGIISIDNTIHNFEYDFIGENIEFEDYSSIKEVDNIKYSLEKDVIIFAKNDKYGIANISSSNIVVPAKYDFITFSSVDNNIYNGFNNGKWQIYDLDNQLIYEDNSANEIHYINKNLFLVREQNKIYIKDNDNKILNNISIEINSYEDEKFYSYDCEAIDNIYIAGEKINFTVLPFGYCSCYSECVHEYEVNEYEYNINTNILKKIN